MKLSKVVLFVTSAVFTFSFVVQSVQANPVKRHQVKHSWMLDKSIIKNLWSDAVDAKALEKLSQQSKAVLVSSRGRRVPVYVMNYSDGVQFRGVREGIFTVYTQGKPFATVRTNRAGYVIAIVGR